MFYLSNRKLRLFIISLLLLIFCFFLGIFKPKAQVIDRNITIGQARVNGSFTSNFTLGNNVFYNEGEGKIVYQFLATGQMNINSISLDYHQSSKTNSICQFGTVSNYNDSANQQVFYSIVCDVDLTNAGIDNLIIKGYAWQTSVIDYSGYLQFSNFESGQDYSNVLGNVDANLNSISSASWLTQNDVSSIKTYIQTMVSNNSQINNNVSDIKDSINDSSIDSNQTSSDTSSWTNMNASNGTITNLLTLPITLLQAIVNGIQTTCSPFSLGSLFGTNLILPCINISELIGSTLFNVIDLLFSGFMILAIAKKLIKIFNDFTNLKSNQMDELYGGGK